MGSNIMPGLKEWALKPGNMGSNPGSTTDELCDFGQVT
jgi:hypothetical protein